jgi:hypothetical protein
MANDDAKDHEARRQLAELSIKRDACVQVREAKEMAIERTLEKNTKKVDDLAKNMNTMNGGINMLKAMMAVLMLLVSVGGLVVAIVSM